MGVWQKERMKIDGTVIKHWVYKFQHLTKSYKGEGFSCRSEAIKAEAARREEVEAPPPVWIPSTSFQEMATEYLINCKRRGMQLNTIRQKAFVIRLFLAFVGEDLPADAVNEKMMQKFLDSRLTLDKPATEKAVNRYLRDLKALYNWGMDPKIGLVESNPCLGIEDLPEDEDPRYVPPPGDVEKVRTVAKGLESDLIETLYYTGGRLGEIVKYRNDTGTRPLTWDDVNFESRWVRLYTRKRGKKGLKVDYMYMGDKLFSILQRRWRKRDSSSPYVFELSQPVARTMMQRLCKQAGVRTFSFHSLRHYAASILDDTGKSTLKEMQDFLRHQRGSTTERYRHNIREKRRTASILEEAAGGNSGRVEHRGTLKRVTQER